MEDIFSLGGDNCSCYSVSVCILFHLLVSLMHHIYIKIFCIRHQLLTEFSFHQLPENFLNSGHRQLLSPYPSLILCSASVLVTTGSISSACSPARLHRWFNSTKIRSHTACSIQQTLLKIKFNFSLGKLLQHQKYSCCMYTALIFHQLQLNHHLNQRKAQHQEQAVK